VNADTLLLHANDAGERLSALVPVWRESTKGGVTKPEMRPKGGGRREKFGNDAFPGLDPCNPLIYHKTGKAFFGNPCRKQAEIWKSLEKSLETAFISPPSLLPCFRGYINRQPDVRGARARLGVDARAEGNRPASGARMGLGRGDDRRRGRARCSSTRSGPGASGAPSISRDSVRGLNGKGSVPRSARCCVAGKVIEVGRPMWHERASLNSSIGMRCRF
jgi:hypothetical protein